MEKNEIEKAEYWVDIKGYEGYYKISNYGSIKSIDRKVGHPRAKNGYALKKGVMLIPKIQKFGLAVVALYKDTEKVVFSINRLVYENFVGDIPNGLYVHCNFNLPNIDIWDNLFLSDTPRYI